MRRKAVNTGLAVRQSRGEGSRRAQSVNSFFVLRVLAVWKLLQKHKFLRRCLARKPAIHAHCSGNDTLKEHVADQAATHAMGRLAGLGFARLRVKGHVSVS